MSLCRSICNILASLAFSIGMLGCGQGGSSALDSEFGNGGPIGDSAFTATPSIYDFGNVMLSGSATGQVTLKNASKKVVFISLIQTTSPSYTVVSDTCPRGSSGMASEESCTVNLRFNAVTAGKVSASLEVKYGLAGSAASAYSSIFGLTGYAVSPFVFAGLDSISSKTHNAMTLNWAPNTEAASFIVFRMVAGVMVFEKVVVNTGGNVASTIVSNLMPSTSYTWRVRGVDLLGSSDSNVQDHTETTNPNTAPVLANIAAQTSYQGILWSVNPSEATTANDTDVDGDALTYTCYYDTTVNGAVASSSACSSLVNEDATAASFNTATGVLTWTPPFSITPGTAYEIKITGSDPYGGSISKIFVNTVSAGLPVLARTPATSLTFPNNYISTSLPLSLDYENSRTGNDSGVSSYACVFDQVVDGAVASGTACTSLPGTATFNTTTGVFNWTPSGLAWGVYEIKVSATNPAGSVSEILLVDVLSPIVTTNLLAYWDATFADGTKPGGNSPLLTAWKDLKSLSTTNDGTLTNMAGTISSGWSSSATPFLSFDGVNDFVDLTNLLSTQTDVALDLWMAPNSSSSSVIWSYGDSTRGLTLKQSPMGDGKLELVTGLKSFHEEILADSPAVFYRFNEVIGPSAFDYSGNKVVGTYIGGVTYQAGGGMTDGDRAVTYSTGSMNSPIAIGPTVTIEVWASAVGVGSVMLWRTGAVGVGPDLFFSSNVALNTWDGANNGFCAIPASAADGNYHQWVTVIDSVNSIATLYFDGAVCGTAAYRNPSATSITFSSNAGYDWNGSMDEAAVYHTALSPARVLAHYQAKNRAVCRSLASVQENKWQHVFASFDNGTKSLKMKINGQDQCSSTSAVAINGSANSLMVASSVSGTSNWSGQVGEMRAYTASTVSAAVNFSATKGKYDTFLPMTSMRLWFSADSLGHIISGNAVPFWRDQSGQANHAYHTTVSKQPTYQAAGLNGKPTLVFNGSNCLQTANADVVTDYSAFVVFSDSTLQSFERLLDKDYTNGFWIGRDDANAGFRTGFKHSAPPYGIATPFANGVAHVASVVRSGTSLKLYSDGGTPVTDTIATGATSSSKYGIGCWYNDGGSQAYEGQLAEVIVYGTALSDADRQRVERYLGAKYGITIP